MGEWDHQVAPPGGVGWIDDDALAVRVPEEGDGSEIEQVARLWIEADDAAGLDAFMDEAAYQDYVASL